MLQFTFKENIFDNFFSTNYVMCARGLYRLSSLILSIESNVIESHRNVFALDRKLFSQNVCY